MSSRRQLFLRVWAVTFALAIAMAWWPLRPDSSLRTLWHLRDVQLQGDKLSNRALFAGSELRAATPEGPAFDEDAYDYAHRVQEIGGQLSHRREQAGRRLAVYLGIIAVIPLLLAALVVAGRNLVLTRKSIRTTRAGGSS